MATKPCTVKCGQIFRVSTELDECFTDFQGFLFHQNCCQHLITAKLNLPRMKFFLENQTFTLRNIRKRFEPKSSSELKIEHNYGMQNELMLCSSHKLYSRLSYTSKGWKFTVDCEITVVLTNRSWLITNIIKDNNSETCKIVFWVSSPSVRQFLGDLFVVK